MKTEARVRIATIGQLVKTVTERPTINEAEGIATALNNLADWFENHPAKWLKGSMKRGRGSNASYCNVGRLRVGGNLIRPVGIGHVRIERATEYLIQLNDHSATLEENLYGLRIIANMWERYAYLVQAGVDKDIAFNKAHKAAFAKNATRLQVQSARRYQRDLAFSK